MSMMILNVTLEFAEIASKTLQKKLKKMALKLNFKVINMINVKILINLRSPQTLTFLLNVQNVKK